MPILEPTDIFGEVCFLGLVTARAASLSSQAVESIEARFEGLVGESHFGLVRASCSRVTSQYPKGTPIRNTRQVSILSREELAETAVAMGLEALEPEWVGANIVLCGVPDLTRVPPGSRLIFRDGASLTVDMENAPCQLPAREIERRHARKGAAYKSAAAGRRGLTAWVEREGRIAMGEPVRLHVPRQRPYPPLATPKDLSRGRNGTR